MRNASVVLPTLAYSSGPHLQECLKVHRFLIPSQLFFFTLHGEHGHAVGEFVAFGADVGGDVGELQFFSMRRYIA